MIKNFPSVDSEKIEKGIDDPLNDQTIIEIIKREMYNAEPTINFKIKKAAIDKLTQDYMAGRFSQKEFEDARKRFSIRSIQTETLVEYRSVLTLVLGKDHPGIEETIKHENSHMNKVQELGLRGHYLFDLSRNEDGSLNLYPHVEPIFPQDITEDKRRELMREIIEAPDELSPGDEFHLSVKDR